MIDHFETLATENGEGESLDARMGAIRNTRIESLEKMLSGHRKIMLVCIALLIGFGAWNGQNLVRTSGDLADTRARIAKLSSIAPPPAAPAGPVETVQARRIELVNDAGQVAVRLAPMSGMLSVM